MTSFFEGPEKRLELTLHPGGASLRRYDFEYWQRFLEKIPAKILSSLSNEFCDAYLLSESSLFVYDCHLILMTCGRTDLIPTTIEWIHSFGIPKIRSVLYERESEHFPEYQPSTFARDVDLLQQCGQGKIFQMGDKRHRISLFRMARGAETPLQYTRLKMRMHGLRPKDQKASLKEVFPDFQTNDHVFKPSGYSLNAIRDKKYFTLHVTPDEPGSYASFETNLELSPQVESGLEMLFQTLKPQHGTLLLFQEKKVSLIPYPFRVNQFRTSLRRTLSNSTGRPRGETASSGRVS